MATIFYKWLMVCGLMVIGAHDSNQSLNGRRHPFYIAVTEINLNTSDKTLEVSCKMFADDLEQTIEKNNHAQLDISSDKDKASFDKYIPAYVKNAMKKRFVC